ncbi:MAG: sel1 repeat family protein [Candidatus Methanomethylophilaceae archaeon]|nr:sel1 repeat family protein [Candidatus Methanomethylophilaceae archaeon]
MELFERAAGMGDSSGMRNLAYCYAIGLNCDKDKARGAQLYEKAAEMGNPRAMCNIGVMCDYGNGVEKDPEKAFMWYERSAKGGYARGMTNLGELYMWGRGTAKDLDKAVEWLERSGSPRAEYRLAEIFLDELGDRDKGMEHLRRSAEGGYSRALYRCGSLIEEEDLGRALEMYRQAALKSNKDAICRLQELGEEVPEPSFRRKRGKS